MEIKEAYNQAAAESTRERREPWNEHEIDLLVTGFIEERKADPFSNSLELFNNSMRKVLPEHRSKNITTWSNITSIRARLGEKWLDEMTKQTPAPLICHVETQAPADYVDILQRCDLPSLVALVVAKLGESAAALKPLLTVLNGANGNGTVGAPHAAPVSLLAQASAKPRKTRVLVVGPQPGQFHEIETRVTEMKIPVELLYYEKDKPTPKTAINCDFVISTFVNKPLHDLFRTSLPAGKYYLLEGAGITQYLNKLRDIGTLLPPRA